MLDLDDLTADELRAEDREQRRRLTRICADCGRMGGDHSTGCPGYDGEDEDEQARISSAQWEAA